jgi:hypothetical protein
MGRNQSIVCSKVQIVILQPEVSSLATSHLELLLQLIQDVLPRFLQLPVAADDACIIGLLPSALQPGPS